MKTDHLTKFKVLKSYGSKLENVPDWVPWEMLNEAQAKSNHSQTLNRLNERGGMCVGEILCNIKNQPIDFITSNTQKDVDELNAMVVDFVKNNQPVNKDEEKSMQLPEPSPLDELIKLVDENNINKLKEKNLQRVSYKDAEDMLIGIIRKFRGPIYEYHQDYAGGTSDTFINIDIMKELIVKITRP